MLIFSQSLKTLDRISALLNHSSFHTTSLPQPLDPSSACPRDGTETERLEEEEEEEEEDLEARQQRREGGGKGGEGGGIRHSRIDGSTGGEERERVIQEFNDDQAFALPVLLISTKAGGEGISLLAANRVIIFDVSWNPSHDVEAAHRAFRSPSSPVACLWSQV